MFTSAPARSPNDAPDGSLQRAVENQMHVIGALILRELHTRFGRNNIGYLWIIAEPMLLAAAVAAIHIGSHTHYGMDIQPVPFALNGYCLFMIFRSVIARSESTLQANRPLLYHRQVTIFDMLLARALLDGISIAATIIILFLAAYALGLSDLPAKPLLLMAATFYMTWFSFAVSMLVCWGTQASHIFERLLHPVVYLLMPISGGFYFLKWIPEPYRDWLWYLPMVHIFEMGRTGVFANFDSPYYSHVYLIGCCLVLTWFGMISLRIARRQVHLN